MRARWLLILLIAGCGRFGFGATGGDDGVHGDGRPSGDGAGSDAVAIPACPTTPILDDDFADGTIGIEWTVVNTGGYTVTEAAGVASIAFPANAAVDSQGAFRQTASQSLVGTCAIAELTAVPANAATAYAYLRIGAPAKFIEIAVEGGQVIGRFHTGTTSGTSGGATYDPVAHRFLRIRAAGGGNYMLEAGPSLTSFTTLGTAGGGVVDPSPTSVEVGGAVKTTMASNAGTAEFDRVLFVGP